METLIIVKVLTSIAGGVVIWVVYELFMPPEKRAYRDNIGDKPCPHGYEDWDDCPDCRH